MILDAIFDLVEALLFAVLDLLPPIWPVDFTDGLVSAAATMWAHLGWLNQYLPIIEAVYSFSALLTLWAGFYAFRFTVWALSKAHILGSGDV